MLRPASLTFLVALGLAAAAGAADIVETARGNPEFSTLVGAIEAAGLADLGQSPAMLKEGRFQIGGDIPVNTSGGVLCTNAIAVTAMVRVAEVAQQVRGKAGGHQVAGARIGIASGNGGDHQFFGTMVVEA